MWQRLNSWQRFWVMFCGVFLASTLAVIAAAWPKADPAVLADLRSPDCAQWRGLPADEAAAAYPDAGAPCQALRLFTIEQRRPLATEADYDRYLAGRVARNALLFLGIWAGFCAVVYVLGWSAGGIVARLRGGRPAPPAS